MTTTNYAPPLDKLLTLGDARPTRAHWPDYRQVGLAPEHIPDLIRMATDQELNQADSDSAEVWAPVHAWRALGQFRAESAVEPLVELSHWIDDDDDDAVGKEAPEVPGMIGPAALPALAAYLADPARGAAARNLGKNVLEDGREKHRRTWISAKQADIVRGPGARPVQHRRPDQASEIGAGRVAER